MLIVPLSIVTSWLFSFSLTVVESIVQGFLCHNCGWDWDVPISVLDVTRGGSRTAALLLPSCEYIVCCSGKERGSPFSVGPRWWSISLEVSAVLMSRFIRPCAPSGIVEETFVLAPSNFAANTDVGPDTHFIPPDWSPKSSTVLWPFFCLKKDERITESI